MSSTSIGSFEHETGDERYMRAALDQAALAGAASEVPIGAVVVVGDRVVSTGYNRSIACSDPTAHAEIVAMRSAAQAIANYRLVGASLFVTVAPCLMCFGAMVHARIARLVYGAPNPEFGRVPPAEGDWTSFNHRFDIRAGVLASECSEMVLEFFRERRSDTVAEPSAGRLGQF
ncbi:MAG: tRNA adenosine(34) deaminase TadA [Pseudomonadales bacterium]|nr:tRNA adenosine(34) deaminase TadA [Pseudomonadales bacterium]